ncbi:hypothetical protein JCM16303_006796 [Sporobolomyces ruberrimus]
MATRQEIDALATLAPELNGSRSVDAGSLDEEKTETSTNGHAEKEIGAAATGSYASGIPQHPWRIKGPAIFLTLFLTLGSNFASSSIGPLKSTIKKELSINNAQYADIAVADSLINTILPIITGIAVDYFGPLSTAIYASTVILLGTILSAIGASTSSYPLVLVGHIVLGFGSTTIETVQSKIYSFYSVGMMGFIYGLDIAIGRVYNLIGKLTAVPIMEGTGDWAWTFGVAAIFCAFTWILTISFFLYERTFPSIHRVPTGRQVAQQKALAAGLAKPSFWSSWKSDRKFFVASLLSIPACFWILDISQLFQAGAVLTYTSNLADTIKVTRNATNAAAGYTSAVGQVIPIVLTPCLGIFFDRFGRRMHWVTATAALWVLVFALLAYTNVHPLVPSILGSLALATNVLPWIASIPLLVPNQANLGTAFGIYKALNNCGSVVMNVASGSIQDQSGNGRTQYRYVFAFIIVIKGLDVLYGLGYNWFDKRYLNGILYANEKERVAREEEDQVLREEGLRRPIRAVTFVSLGVVGAMIVIAWVLYLYYSV